MYLIPEIEYIKMENGEWIIVNLLNAATDIISNDLYYKLCNNNYDNIEKDILKRLIVRRYVFYTEQEYALYVKELNDTIDDKEMGSNPNFLVIPTYACNLKCVYCYENSYEINHREVVSDSAQFNLQFETIDKIVKEKSLKNDNIVITIMGGEPLLKNNYEAIKLAFSIAKERGYKISIVTNGVELNYFIDLLKEYNRDVLSHIQVTLDGCKDVHDNRRMFGNQLGTFEIIWRNIKLALNNKIEIYIRVNVDNENIETLPELAKLIKDEMYMTSYVHPYIYLLQDGGCSGFSKVLDEGQGIEKILELRKKYPAMNIFYIKNHLSPLIDAIINDMPFKPMLRHCAASRNQYILDCKNNIYKCWHGIGSEEFKIGTFDTELRIITELEEEWKNRMVTNLEKCSGCKYRYMCGTGCPAATHIETEYMDISRPHCIEYSELLNLIIPKLFESK